MVDRLMSDRDPGAAPAASPAPAAGAAAEGPARPRPDAAGADPLLGGAGSVAGPIGVPEGRTGTSHASRSAIGKAAGMVISPPVCEPDQRIRLRAVAGEIHAPAPPSVPWPGSSGRHRGGWRRPGRRSRCRSRRAGRGNGICRSVRPCPRRRSPAPFRPARRAVAPRIEAPAPNRPLLASRPTKRDFSGASAPVVRGAAVSRRDHRFADPPRASRNEPERCVC